MQKRKKSAFNNIWTGEKVKRGEKERNKLNYCSQKSYLKWIKVVMLFALFGLLQL
jgi:hypothetical protein